MAKGTALVKSIERYGKLIVTFPDRADFYREKIEEAEAEIRKMMVCRRCGRLLKDEHAREIGYGKECESRTKAELETEATTK